MHDIKRKTHKKYSAEEKIRIVLEGLPGEETIATICRREDINPNLYYKWSRDFLEPGRRRLKGVIKREAISREVMDFLNANEELKRVVT